MGKNATKLKIITFNCQGIASQDRMFEFEKAWEKQEFDIVGISETKIYGENFKSEKMEIYYFTAGKLTATEELAFISIKNGRRKFQK